VAELTFTERPVAQSCRRIDFDSAHVSPGIVPNTFFLTVTGTTPCVNMEVSLVPLVYVRCPEYWEIEVVGCLPSGICLTAIGQFSKTIELTPTMRGSKGVAVVGGTKRKEMEVSGGCAEGFEFHG